MTTLALFDLEPEVPTPARRERCAHGRDCLHPDHINGTYVWGEGPTWGTYPCHECGTELNRYRRCGHWNLDANAWKHLRIHAYTRTPLGMHGALWIGHPQQIIRGRNA